MRGRQEARGRKETRGMQEARGRKETRGGGDIKGQSKGQQGQRWNRGEWWWWGGHTSSKDPVRRPREAPPSMAPVDGGGDGGPRVLR